MKGNTYFNVDIDKNISEEFQYLLEKAPYTTEKEIGELFSHLVYIDEIQKEKNAQDSKISDKVIKLKFMYNDNDGAKVENLQIPFGQGHFSKGIKHLREIGKIDWENQLKEQNLDEELGKTYDKYLTKPPATDVLTEVGSSTLKQCAKILETVPSPELQGFIAAFMGGDEKARNKLFVKDEENEKKQDSTKDKEETKKPSENEKNKEYKVKDFKQEVKSAAQKKRNNTKEREKIRSNYKDLGIKYA